MKIKRKVEMTPEEYAKYMIDKHGVSGYESELIDENIIGGPERFTQTIELNPVSKKDLPNKVFWDGKMTVEVEEEITEDTIIPKLTRYTAFGFKGTKYNTSINDVKSHDSLAFYIMNDDLTMTLIWTHEKGLVE